MIRKKQIEPAYQQSPAQKPSLRLVVKVPKMSVYNKRNSSEALGANSQQDTPKKMKITTPTQIVDLEEEEPKGKTCMEIVEGATKNKISWYGKHATK
jgi:hypothetical protein